MREREKLGRTERNNDPFPLGHADPDDSCLSGPATLCVCLQQPTGVTSLGGHDELPNLVMVQEGGALEGYVIDRHFISRAREMIRVTCEYNVADRISFQGEESLLQL